MIRGADTGGTMIRSLLSCLLMLQVLLFSLQVATVQARADAATEYQIHAHANGYANDAPIQPQAKQCGKQQPRGNGQNNRNDHCEFYVPGGPQPAAQRTGKRICQAVKNIIDEDQPEHQLFRFGEMAE